MGTFDHRWMIDQMMRNNGWMDEFNDPIERHMPDNPPAVKIVEYTNFEGVVFEYERDKDRYNRPTEYVRNPKTIWERT